MHLTLGFNMLHFHDPWIFDLWLMWLLITIGYYHKTSNISRTAVGNEIVDNYIFILNFTPGFNGLSEDNCKGIQETFKFWDLVRFILEVLR